MRIAVFSTKPYDRRFLEAANEDGAHELVFFEERLYAGTASLADGSDAVCAFVDDTLDAEALTRLAAGGVRLVALRSAGFNHVDLDAAARLGLAVARVPAYSPYAIAEHTIGLMPALERKIRRAHARVREGILSLEGSLGHDLRGRTIGMVGTGRIGTAVAKILCGFGCRLLAYDLAPNPELSDHDVAYVSLDRLLAESDVVTLHCPLTPDTHHLIDEASLAKMRDGAMLINTSRGVPVDTSAAIEALKAGKIGSMGLDVYEEEGDLFFEDLSDRVIQDDVFRSLLTFPNVIAPGHLAFFTENALREIAETTLRHASDLQSGREIPNLVIRD